MDLHLAVGRRVRDDGELTLQVLAPKLAASLAGRYEDIDGIVSEAPMRPICYHEGASQRWNVDP